MNRCVWTICLAMMSMGCGKTADPGPAATTTPETTPVKAQPVKKLDPTLTLVMPFDDGMHGCRGSINPFAAIGHAELVDDPARPGKVLQLAGHRDPQTDKLKTSYHRSAVVIDGRNVPEEAATIGVSVRFGKGFGWSDGKKTWLLTLAPGLPGLFAGSTIPATGLAVWKDENNDLVLGEYRFGNGRLSPTFASGHEIAKPDREVCRIPTGKLGADAWARVRLGFDRKRSTVWLGLDDKLEQGKVEFRGPRYNALIVACPPKLNWVKQAGLNGRIDDIVVSRETPDQDATVAMKLPEDLPAMAQPEPARRVAVHLADSEPGATMEAMVRAHCTMVLEQQSVGGWRFSTAWPSGLDFLARNVVLPYTKNYFNGSKDQNSGYCAAMLIAGYFAVGDEAFLKGAERTAETLLALQGDDGGWPSNAYWDDQKQEFIVSSRPHYVSIEDHIQTMPIVLMMVLNNLTGKKVYQESAQKGVDFLVMAQNPNGSWSHHWNRKIKAGQSARGHVYGGELNDSTTTDPMRLMLLMYRRTGDIKYLASWLRAAEWFYDAFIDKKAKGWAQQYDRNNNPVQARHFEPAAVGMLEASDWGARGLMHAYRLTGDKRYLEPINKFYDWAMANRVFLNDEKTEWGWHRYYDPETGEPFSYAYRKRGPVDPKDAGHQHINRVLREIKNVEKPVGYDYVPGPETGRKRLEAAEGAVEIEGDAVHNRLRPMPLVESFDWTAGSWLFKGDEPTGLKVNTGTIRVALIAWSVFLRRQVAGQIPWDHPMSTLDRDQWGSPFYYVMPPATFNKRLTPEELDRARQYIKDNPITPTLEGLTAPRN